MTLDSSHYSSSVGDLLEVTPGLSLSSPKAFGYNHQETPVNPFFGCITEGRSSPSPTASSTWSTSSRASPMVPTGLSGFTALNVAVRAAPFPVAELRSDENVLPDAFCAEVRYNVAQDFDSSGYSEPVDGVSQLGFGTIPSRTSPVFGDYGTGVAVHVDQKDNLWTEPHFQVLSFGNERGAVHNPLEKPAPCTPRASQQRTLDLKLGGCKSDPYAMREHWIQVARSSHVNESDVGKVFSKNPKTRVATPNTLRASALRRKHPAKFKCPVNGCLDDFTRKHNLENHLRSHCGVTDLICPLCNKGFTTIPVLKRHHRSCARTAASLGSQHSKSFLAMLTAEEREPKLLIS